MTKFNQKAIEENQALNLFLDDLKEDDAKKMVEIINFWRTDGSFNIDLYLKLKTLKLSKIN